MISLHGTMNFVNGIFLMMAMASADTIKTINDVTGIMYSGEPSEPCSLNPKSPLLKTSKIKI